MASGTIGTMAVAEQADPTYLSIVEARRYVLRRFGIPCSEDTLRNRIRDGQLPAVRFGRSPRAPLWIKPADLDALLRTVEPKHITTTEVQRPDQLEDDDDQMPF